MCVYVYACLSVVLCVSVCDSARLHVNVCVSEYACLYVHMSERVSARKCVCVCLRVCKSMCE